MKNGKPLILAIETSGRLGSVALAEGEKLLAEKQFTGPMRHSAEIFTDIVSLLEQFNKKPTDLQQVYISIGPGSFTGLRIAVTIAKTIALANQTQIVAVDTLDCIAANVTSCVVRPASCDKNTQHAALGGVPSEIAKQFRGPSIGNLSDFSMSFWRDADRLAIILDAKRGQFFVAVYEKSTIDNRQSTINKIVPDCLLTADEFMTRFSDKQIALIGEGLVYYMDNFKSPNIQILDEKYWNPSAANIHKIGWQKALAGEFSDPLTLVPNYLRGPDVKIKQM
jgi:tRNA threonylcarbamoyladenosine biosynthesis protein TsaB